jgi:excisionase family DNA binding protein
MNAGPEVCLTLAEVGRRLGISIRQVYRLIHRGELPPALKVGRAARIPESEVAAYIENLKRRRGPSYAALSS